MTAGSRTSAAAPAARTGQRRGALTSDPLDCEAPDDGWDDKARAVFDNADAASALRRIVAATATRAAKASLAKGIVVLGHSQGSWMAHMAETFTTRGGTRMAARWPGPC